MNIFLHISFNICFWCSKEPSHWDGSFEYPQHMVWLRNKKINFSVQALNSRSEFVEIFSTTRNQYVNLGKVADRVLGTISQTAETGRVCSTNLFLWLFCSLLNFFKIYFFTNILLGIKQACLLMGRRAPQGSGLWVEASPWVAFSPWMHQ